ncbi:KilA-N domain-containing protein [Metapseudomonas sp. CR1201]
MTNVVNLQDYQTREVVIDGFKVRQDAEGRYCLNDVHKASGGEEIKKPKEWLKNQQTQELITRLKEKEGIHPFTVKVGRNGGTFAVEELVYAYAEWISPEYHLKVLGVYKRAVNDGVAVHEISAADLLDNPLKYMERCMVSCSARTSQLRRKSKHSSVVSASFT